MSELRTPQDEHLQDYIAGRLNQHDQAQVAAYLLANPEAAAEIEVLRRQNEALKMLGQNILEEPVQERLQAALRQPAAAAQPPSSRLSRTPRLVEAAAAIFLFCAGGAVGWFLKGELHPRSSAEELLAAQLAYSYSFYGSEPDYPVDFPPERLEDLGALITRAFERQIQPPDLSEFKYAYAGGRLAPLAGSRVGQFQFKNGDNTRMALFFWKSGEAGPSLSSIQPQNGINVKFWLTGDLNFALISDSGNQDFERVAGAVASFYDTMTGRQ